MSPRKRSNLEEEIEVIDSAGCCFVFFRKDLFFSYPESNKVCLVGEKVTVMECVIGKPLRISYPFSGAEVVWEGLNPVISISQVTLELEHSALG